MDFTIGRIGVDGSVISMLSFHQKSSLYAERHSILLAKYWKGLRPSLLGASYDSVRLLASVL